MSIPDTPGSDPPFFKQCLNSPLFITVTHAHTGKRGRTKHIKAQKYSPCWVLPLGLWQRKGSQERSAREEESNREKRKRFGVSFDALKINSSCESAKVTLNCDCSLLIKTQTYYCAWYQSPLFTSLFSQLVAFSLLILLFRNKSRSAHGLQTRMSYYRRSTWQ